MSVSELLQHINDEDSRVADAVHEALPQIQAFVEAVEQRMKRGGRLFYVGAGTSGRLGVLDASELPPTFGAPDTWVIGIIAGGNKALRKAVEQAEDDPEQGWTDILAYHPTTDDSLLGIAASGTTPYVVGALRLARQNGLLAGCITSNRNGFQPHEEWYGPEDGAEYDFYLVDDQAGSCERQSYGEDAVDEQETGRSWYSDAAGNAGPKL